MSANWEKMIKENMKPLEIPGREAPVYRPKGDQASVWILTDVGEFPPPPPPLERYEMAPGGGRELTLDVSDPDFLLAHKAVGMAEYTHCIPWGKIVDIIFRHV